MEANGRSDDIRDRLMEDLQLLIKDAEDLLKNTGQHVDERYQQARAKFESTLGFAKDNWSTIEEQVTTTARSAYETSNQFVQEKPWQAVGIGAVAGIMIGLMMGRR